MDVRLYHACLKAVPRPKNGPTSASTFQAGYTDAAKLGEAAAVGAPVAGTVHEPFSSTIIPVGGNDIFCARVAPILDFHGRKQLPPVRATFLAFGVAPVTATAILTQQAPLTAIIYQSQGPGGLDLNRRGVAVAIARLGLRITDVSVDGRRLDVGPRCHAVGSLTTPGNPIAPGAVMLTGGNRLTDQLPHFATLEGSLAGLVTIPPFANCVTPSGENLDPLLTASVSGPGNYVKLVQGFACPNPSPAFCESIGVSPFPEFTVTRGGRFHASAPLTVSISNANTSSGFVTITCTGSAVSGAFPDTSGPLRGALASLRLRIKGCTGDDGSRWQVAVRHTVFFEGLIGITGGFTEGSAEDMSLVLTGTGTGKHGTCRAVLNGNDFATYVNATSALSIAPDGPGEGNINVDASTCPDVPRTEVATGGAATVTAVYTLIPGGIRITSP